MRSLYGLVLLLALVACPSAGQLNFNPNASNELAALQKTAFLTAVNAKRAAGADCLSNSNRSDPGHQVLPNPAASTASDPQFIHRFTAAPALVWNAKLEQMAASHSETLALKAVDIQTVDPHAGVGDGDVLNRAAKVGYNFLALGENIAAGQTSVQEVVDAWMTSSAGHCDNLMDKGYAQLGVALRSVSSGPFKTYWTLNLGKPQ